MSGSVVLVEVEVQRSRREPKRYASGVLGETPDTVVPIGEQLQQGFPIVKGGRGVGAKGITIVCGKAVATRLHIRIGNPKQRRKDRGGCRHDRRKTAKRYLLEPLAAKPSTVDVRENQKRDTEWMNPRGVFL